jgi:hypothetical protein
MKVFASGTADMVVVDTEICGEIKSIIALVFDVTVPVASCPGFCLCHSSIRSSMQLPGKFQGTNVPLGSTSLFSTFLFILPDARRGGK